MVVQAFNNLIQISVITTNAGYDNNPLKLTSIKPFISTN